MKSWSYSLANKIPGDRPIAAAPHHLMKSRGRAAPAHTNHKRDEWMNEQTVTGRGAVVQVWAPSQQVACPLWDFTVSVTYMVWFGYTANTSGYCGKFEHIDYPLSTSRALHLTPVPAGHGCVATTGGNPLCQQVCQCPLNQCASYRWLFSLRWVKFTCKGA